MRLEIAVGLESKQKTVVRERSLDVICDFVDGIAFGDALGVGLRSIDGWWTIKDLILPSDFPSVGQYFYV